MPFHSHNNRDINTDRLRNISPDLLTRMLDQCSWTAVLTTAFLVPVFHAPHCLNKFELPKVALLNILVCAAYAAGLPVWLSRKRWKSVRVSNVLPILLLVAFSLVSTALSLHPPTSWQGSLARQNGTRTLLAFIAWYVLVHFSCQHDFRRVKMLLWVFIAASVPMCVYGILQYFGLDLTAGMSLGESARPHGTLAYVNLLAGYLSFVLPLIALLLLGTVKTAARILLHLLFGVGWYLLVATYCRGAWVAVILMVLMSVVALVICREQRLWRKVVFLPVIAFVATIFFQATPSILSRDVQQSADLLGVTQRSPMERLASSFDSGELTVTSRVHMWRIALQISSEYPWFGSGPETFIYLVPTKRTMKDSELFGRRGLVENAHSEIFHLAANSGFLTVFAYVWMLAAHLVAAIGTVRATSDRRVKTVMSALILILLAYVGRSQVNVNSVENNLFFWAVLAILGTWNCPTPLSPKAKTTLFAVFSAGVLAVSLVASTAMTSVLVKPYLAGMLSHRGTGAAWREEFPSAIRHYERAIELAPNEPDYRVRLGETYIALARKDSALREKSLRKALECFDWLVKFNPNNFLYWSKRGQAYTVFGDLVDQQFYSKSVGDLEEALALAPYASELHGYLGQVYSRMQIWDKAFLQTEIAAQMDATNTHHRRSLGNILIAQERFTEAEHHLRRLLQIDPENAEGHNSLGVALAGQGRTDEARSAFLRALQISPAMQDARKNLNILDGERSSPGSWSNVNKDSPHRSE